MVGSFKENSNLNVFLKLYASPSSKKKIRKMINKLWEKSKDNKHEEANQIGQQIMVLVDSYIKDKNIVFPK